MKIHDGHIRYNSSQDCYGMVDEDGNWIKEKFKDGDRIDVLINGERFSTNFVEDYYYKALKPQPWDNWEYLTKLPAAYYEFETEPKNKPSTKEDERRLRFRLAFLFIGMSLAVSVLLGAIFALIGIKEKPYLESFIAFSKVMFWFIGAGVAAGGILLLANIVPLNLCIGFGCALYYGTVLLSAFLSNFIYGAESNRYVISFVIVSLVCYIVWLKEFKSKYPTEK